MRRLFRSCVFLAALVFVMPAQARADWFISPWAGVNFGSDTSNIFDSDVSNGRGAFGVSAGGMGGGIIGGEATFGYSPSFFGTDNDFGNNTVIDFMGNVIIGIPIGGQHGAGFRPYVVGGVGLIRSQIDGGTLVDVESSTNDFGWDAGVGAMGYFNDHIGLRGDVRYLRTFSGDTLEDLGLGNLHYWRASIGLTFR